MALNSNILIHLRLLGRQAVRAGTQGAARDLDAVDRAGRRLNTSFGALAMGGTVAAAGIGAVVAAVARMGAETNATQDAQRVSFTALLKSKQKAADMMKEIQQLALDSPILDPASTGDAVRMLLAYGISADRTIPLVKALGDMSAASGKAIAEVMPRAALALGQIEGKGRLQAQEMNQLAESVGLSRKAIRKELGMTAKEFEETFKPGKNIKSDVAIPAIMRAMTNQSAGAADMLAKTTAGRIARGKEVMKLAAGDFTRPFYDEIGRLAGKAGDKLSDLQTSGKFKGFSRGLFSGQGGRERKAGGFTAAGAAQNTGAAINRTVSKVGGALAGAGSRLLDAFRPLAPFLSNILLPLLKGIAMGVGGAVVGAFNVLVPVIKAVATGLGWLGEKAGPGAKKIFEGIGKVIGFIFGPAILRVLSWLKFLGPVFKVLSIPLRLLGRLFGVAAKAIGWVAGQASKVLARLKPLGQAIGNWLAPRLARASAGLSVLKRGFSIVTAPIRTVWGWVGRLAGRFGGLWDKVKDLASAVGGKLKSAFDKAKPIFNVFADGVKIALTPLRELAKLAGALGLIGPDTLNTSGLSNLGSKINDALEETGTQERYRGPSSRGGGGPAGERQQMRRRPAAPVIVHNTLTLDGQIVHQSTAKRERRLQEARR